jgi:hypothetical protein
MSPLIQFDMTDEQVKLAGEAGRLAARHLGGIKLAEGLKIGAMLLVGRAAAMKAAGVNAPLGRPYAEAFSEWKRSFKFPEGKEAQDFYDQAIVCAQHLAITEGIIAGLSAKQKPEMGVFGLAKRVRAKLNEFEGASKATQPKRQRAGHVASEFAGRLADIEERQMSEEPLKWWRDSPEEIGRAMARVDSVAFRRLSAAGLAALEGPPLLENNREH